MQATHVDLAADTIEGIATPGNFVSVGGTADGIHFTSRWVLVDGSGHWIADFHNPGVDWDQNPILDTLDIKEDSMGQAYDIDHEGFTSNGGNATWVDWGPPWARIEASPWIACVGDPITLQAIEAYDYQGNDMTFDWDRRRR
jgi:hypothetical protein